MAEGFIRRRAPVALCLLCAVWLAAAASCVRLPRRQQVTPAPGAQVPANNATLPNPPTRVSLNTATREELERLPGVGSALAARIIEHRQRYGPFRRAEHVMMVRGIGERRFRQMRAYVTAE